MSGDNLYVNPNTGKRRCIACHNERQRSNSGRVKLPAEPFARWLRRNVPEGVHERNLWALAHGLDDSQLRRLLRGEQKLVHIDTVDRTFLGRPYMLEELYPYELEDVA